MTKPTTVLFLGLLISILALPGCAKATNGADAAKPDQGENETVALVHGDPFTLADLERKATGGLKSLEQQRYELLRQALDALVVEKVVREEADARGVTPEELLETEIQGKVAEPTPQEVEAYYEANKARAGGHSLREVGNSIVAILTRQRTDARRQEFLDSLREKAGVEVLLEPPRFEVAVPPSAPAKGSAAAPVTIVEYADYQCPYCKQANPAVTRLVAEYGDRVRYVFRDFPLDFHPRAVPASMAAHCAGEQEKYWEYHANLMEMQGDLSVDDLVKRAQTVGLDVKAFEACMDAERYAAAIDDSFAEGQAMGVTGTPSFFVNGMLVVGVKSYDEWKNLVDKELARVGAGDQARAAN